MKKKIKQTVEEELLKKVLERESDEVYTYLFLPLLQCFIHNKNIYFSTTMFT